MKDANRPIFRAEAVRRYIQNSEQAVLPRFVSPGIFLGLWLFLGLLTLGGVTLLLVIVRLLGGS